MSQRSSRIPADKCMEELHLQLAKRGYRACIVSVNHLPELREDIERRYTQGLFDKEFYHERLAFFDFQLPDSLPKAKSIIVVAVPRPQSQAVFTWKGEIDTLILPPTYVPYEGTTKRVKALLAKILGARGYRVALTALPLKLLAVRSGLGDYGRNNICYVPGMGSFHQLVAVYSDLPCQGDTWREPQMMKRCQNCQACLRNCPTGAISSDRFLLHAERCIVFHNEKKGSIRFPAWIDPSWHNCLYGCLHCQRVCPEDNSFMQWIEESEEFSEKETVMLLDGVPRERLPAATVRKLTHLELIDNLDSLSRNLSVFLKPKA